jgi:hypothetical protein
MSPRAKRVRKPRASREREKQEQVLENTAGQESWTKRLERTERESKGRPKSRNRRAP